MEFSEAYVSSIPEPHCDFLLALGPIVDSQRKGSVLQISGINFSQLYGILSRRHGYEPFEARQVADDLRENGFVEEDSLGFFQPTAKGKSLLLAMQRQPREASRVPQFPQH